MYVPLQLTTRLGEHQTFTLMMASAQVVETSVNTNNSPSQDYTTNPDDHSNHNKDFLLNLGLGESYVVLFVRATELH